MSGYPTGFVASSDGQIQMIFDLNHDWITWWFYL